MLNAILVLTRARWLIAKNTFWRGKIGVKIGTVVVLAVLGLVAFVLYNLMSFAVRGITSPNFVELLQEARREQPELNIPTDFIPYLDALPSLALFAALITLIFTSFSSVLSSLYLSGDIDTLLAAPIPMRAVFVVKFFGGLVTPYLLLFVLLGPALFGYGQGRDFGPAFYVFGALILLLFPLLPAGLGALLVMAIVRIIPARRAREIAGVLGGLLAAVWYIGAQFTSEIAPQVASVETLDALRQLNVPLLPSAWAGRALIAAGQGEWLALLAYGGLFTVLSITVFAACLLLAERLYYVGWSNLATQGGAIKAKGKKQTVKNETQPFYLLPVTFYLPPPARAIVFKDLRLFPRDLRNLQQLIFPLALAGIWMYRIITDDSTLQEPDSPVLQSFSLLGSAGISFFICLTISGVLAGSGVSREGKGFWLLKVAPITARQLLLGKLTLAYLPFPLIGTLFVVVLSILQGSTLLQFLTALALVLLTGLGTTSISLGLGATFPRLNWDNPQQQTTWQAGCLTFLAYGIYLVIVLAVAIGIPAIGTFAPDWAIFITIGSWLLFIGLTVAVVWAMLSLGATRLERLELA
jgi:ABC-2 type transport system permease protein